MLTPLDIQKKEFRRAWRGYCEEEVNTFLDQAAQEFEYLIRENQELKEKVIQTEQSVAHYREMEEAIKKTLVMAQKSTDDLRQNAEKEANILLDRSRLEADQLTREAEQQAEGLLREAEKRVSEMNFEYERIKMEAHIFKVRLRSFLESQIKILDQAEELPGEEDLAEAVS